MMSLNHCLRNIPENIVHLTELRYLIWKIKLIIFKNLILIKKITEELIIIKLKIFYILMNKFINQSKKSIIFNEKYNKF